MHLSVRLPKVEPLHLEPPTRCPLPNPENPKRLCSGTQFKEHEWNCQKPVRDIRYARVSARRYRCLKCNRTFRVYPTGVSHLQQSDALKGLSILLYILGLSYQGTSDLLDSLGFFLSKTTVYRNVQAAGRQAIRLRQEWLRHQAGQVPVLSADFTHVKCGGRQRIVAAATAVLTGQPITFDLLETEKTLHIKQWLEETAKVLGAELLVTDDADGLKTVADDLGLQHQIGRAHVNRKVHDRMGALGTQVMEYPDPIPWELKPFGASWEQFAEDRTTVEGIICGIPSNGQQQLEALFERYQGASAPAQGKRATMGYRFRRLVLDWSENWTRLALYQCWRGQRGEKLDGTNNVTEQIIGQSIKERYRTMRGYKRDESILNVSSLIGWIRAQKPGYDLTLLVA